VVTEYAWDASNCDPCPTPPLDASELSVLGADVLADPGLGDEERPSPRRRGPGGSGGFVLTRLHARYAKDSLGEDLVFRAAGPIMGGRETRGANGALENGAKPGSINNFQGRYAVRHPWTGAIACKNPQRGVWGGPPAGGRPNTTPIRDTAFVARGKMQLATIVKGPVPDVVALPGAVSPLGSPVVPVPAVAPGPAPTTAEAPPTTPPDAGSTPGDAGAAGPPPVAPSDRGCGCEAAGLRGDAIALGGLAIGLALALAARRRRG
jgi:hypothetical protein